MLASRLDIVIQPSNRKYKKWKATIKSKDGVNKVIHYGDNRYEDYTMHKDDKRKQRYITRNMNQFEAWAFNRENLLKPAFYAKWLLWHEPTFEESIKSVNKKIRGIGRIRLA